MGDDCRLNIAASGGTGNYSYEWNSVPPGFSSGEKDPLVMPVTATKYIARLMDGQSVCTDTIRVEVIAPPSVDPGNDTGYCDYTDKILLEGRASGVVSVKWTTSGDGIFSDEASLITDNFPGVNDKSLGSVSLKLAGIPQPPCPQASLVKHITFQPCPGIGEWAPGTPYFDVFPNPSGGRFYIKLTGFPSSPVLIQIINPSLPPFRFEDDLYGLRFLRRIGRRIIDRLGGCLFRFSR